jgi:hypothetical protein
MGITNIHDYVARVEQAVRDNLRGARVIALIEVEGIEREGYWERIYVVAWQREDQCGTHRVNVNSKDKSACFFGNYDMTVDRALIDFVDRGLPGNIGAANFLRRK